MASSDEMQTFRALSYGKKRRITRLVAKGEAPDDPIMAAATVELAESYQRREGGTSTLFRWILLVLAAGGLGVLAAVGGDALLIIAMALIVLTNIAHLAFNPAARPQNVARSLEASRQVSAAARR